MELDVEDNPSVLRSEMDEEVDTTSDEEGATELLYPGGSPGEVDCVEEPGLESTVLGREVVDDVEEMAIEVVEGLELSSKELGEVGVDVVDELLSTSEVDTGALEEGCGAGVKIMTTIVEAVGESGGSVYVVIPDIDDVPVYCRVEVIVTRRGLG